ncbi:MAG: hypothetical protein NZM38_11345 [Cytophagales bacterium]|nr:hypothetical protein [Cytophagales bacterium]MDW8385351.1 hypothetical protein [Flammeovirgaceae bacterium]
MWKEIKKEFSVLSLRQKILWVFTILFTAVGFLAFRKKTLNEQQMIVHIKGQEGNFFITEKDVKSLVLRICKAERDSMNELNIDKIEKALRRHKFVRDVQVALNLNGTLIISIEQDQPIARLISPRGQQGYLSARYTILPLSEYYTPRVVVLTGNGVDSLFSESFLQSQQSKTFREFLEFINRDAFWQKQIAQIDIDAKMNMTLFTLVASPCIEFGRAENYQTKLWKIKRFYEEVLPKVGWNKYNFVNVQYKNQIICR